MLLVSLNLFSLVWLSHFPHSGILSFPPHEKVKRKHKNHCHRWRLFFYILIQFVENCVFTLGFRKFSWLIMLLKAYPCSLVNKLLRWFHQHWISCQIICRSTKREKKRTEIAIVIKNVFCTVAIEMGSMYIRMYAILSFSFRF